MPSGGIRRGGEGRRRCWRGSVVTEIGPGLSLWGEVEVEDSALALGGIEVDKAAGAGDDAVDGGEAKAGALFLGLGGEERVEDVLEGIFVHSATGIGNGDTDVRARFEGAVADTDGHFDLGEVGLDINLAGTVDGVAGIDEHIQAGLMQLGGVDGDRGKFCIAGEGSADPFWERFGSDALEFLHDIGDLNFPEIAFFGGFGKGEDLLNDGAGAGSAVLNNIDISVEGRVVGLAMEQLRGHSDGGEEIVEVVCDGAGHLGDALKAVGIHEKEFEAAPVFQFIGGEGFLGGDGGILGCFGPAEADYFKGKVG